jgi:hypothetical protein
MAQTDTTEIPSDDITVNLNYAIDTGEKPVNETMGAGDMSRRRTGKFESRAVTMHDGRGHRDQFRLEVEGFEFVDHDTAVDDFYDSEQVRSVYYPEIEELVKQRTGASRVVIFDHTVRSGDEGTRTEKLVREPVKSVHNDYTEWSGPQRVRDLLPADEAERLLKHRFAVVQVWRAIRNPIESDPLAICDARTLEAGDLIASERRYPNRVGETYQISYNPGHRWFYFPRMARNEALVFKVYDSATDGRARFTAHSAFQDPTTPSGAPARESIEMRTLAFFEDD